MGLTWTQRARADAGVSASTGTTIYVADAQAAFPSTYQATTQVSCVVEDMNAILAVKGLSISPAQATASAATTAGLLTYSLAFGANNVAGNTIIVAFGCSPNAFGAVTVNVSDTQGNTYSHPLHNLLLGGVQQLDIFIATNIIGGPNTITITASGGGGGLSNAFGAPGLAILEYTGAGTFDAVTLAESATGGNLTASITTSASYDLLLNIVALGPRCDPPSPALSSPATPVFQRGNIDFDQIRSSVRSGPAGTFAMLATAHPAAGNAATFDGSGNLIDSGIVPGTVTHSGGALTADEPVFGAGGADVKVGTKRGNNDTVQCADSTVNPTNGNLAEFDANGNIKDAGVAASAILSNPMTTKGDVIVGAVGGTPARLAVGTDGQVLTAKAGATDGVDWEAPIALTTTGTSGASTLTPGNPYVLNVPQYTGGGGSGALTQIAQIVVAGTTTASVLFSAIPGTFSQLELWIMGRTTAAANNENIGVQFNADATAAHYFSFFTILGGATGSNNDNLHFCGLAGGNAFASEPGIVVIDIPGYTNTTFLKKVLSSENIPNSNVFAAPLQIDRVTTWNSAVAITSIQLATTTVGSKFVAGSTFTLYGRS